MRTYFLLKLYHLCGHTAILQYSIASSYPENLFGVSAICLSVYDDQNLAKEAL